MTTNRRAGTLAVPLALAFGTASIRPVDKIVGPGNAYVAEAKRQVFGEVGIDMIAGPSEVLVVADGDQDAAWIAADLLSQAEHDERAQAVLITDSAALAERVAAWSEVDGVWHFNGMDNTFYFTVLYPALLAAAGLPTARAARGLIGP